LPPRQAESEPAGEWLRFDESGPLVQPVTQLTIAIERPRPSAVNNWTFLVFTGFTALFQAFLIYKHNHTSRPKIIYGVFSPEKTPLDRFLKTCCMPEPGSYSIHVIQ
jgi:hypothetical protein